MENNTIRIYNRKLEQALYYLGCDWMECGKELGLTYWIFPKTDKVLWIVGAFNASYQERNRKGVA